MVIVQLIRPSIIKDNILEGAYILKDSQSFKSLFGIYLYLVFSFIFVALIHYEYYKKDYENYSLRKIFKSEFKEIGFDKIKPHSTSHFFVFFTILVIYILMRIEFLSFTGTYAHHIWSLTVFLAPMTLSEELFVRYGLFKVLRQSKINSFWAYIIPALVFSSMHYYYNMGCSPLYSTISAFFMSLFFQFAYESTGWSIYIPWFLHLFQDLVVLFP